MSTENLTLLNAMTQQLKWHEERQKVLAQNIANANTPGYQAQDLKPLDFKNLLSSTTSPASLGAGSVPSVSSSGLQTTNAMHLTTTGALAGAEKTTARNEKDPYEVSPDNNSVVLEEQLVKMNQNFTDHTFVTNLYQKNIQLLKEATTSQ